jgi:hypothetical protein
MIRIVVFVDWLIYYYFDKTQRDGSYQTSPVYCFRLHFPKAFFNAIFHVGLNFTIGLYVWGFAEDSSFTGCSALSTGNYLRTFRKSLRPTYLGSSNLKISWNSAFRTSVTISSGDGATFQAILFFTNIVARKSNIVKGRNSLILADGLLHVPSN